MRKILAVGNDEQLLWSRCRLLRVCSADVRSANYAEALRLLSSQHFDLVILCDTLSSAAIAGMSQLTRERQEDAIVLQVVSKEGDDGNDAADIASPGDPKSLITTVSRILKHRSTLLLDGCEESNLGGRR